MGLLYVDVVGPVCPWPVGVPGVRSWDAPGCGPVPPEV